MHRPSFSQHVLLASCHQVKVGGPRSCVPDVDVESGKVMQCFVKQQEKGFHVIYILGGGGTTTLSYKHRHTQ